LLRLYTQIIIFLVGTSRHVECQLMREFFGQCFGNDFAQILADLQYDG